MLPCFWLSWYLMVRNWHEPLEGRRAIALDYDGLSGEISQRQKMLVWRASVSTPPITIAKGGPMYIPTGQVAPTQPARLPREH